MPVQLGPRHLLIFQFPVMQSETSRDSSTEPVLSGAEGLGITETRDHWYSRPGIWFWVVIAFGMALRFYLVVFTKGTFDADLWEGHSRDVIERGVVACYHINGSANHPPFISELEAVLLRTSDAMHIPFRIFLRAPFALLDAGSAFLLLLLLTANPWRYLVTALYWINPLTIILSAYHGNVDSAVGFFILLGVWLLSKEKIISAAAAIGIGLWIKLPAVLAIPALVFYVQGWRRRLWFLGMVGIVGVVGYLPALIQDPRVIYGNVLAYRAQNLHTTTGVTTWGPRVILFSILAAPNKWPTLTHAPILFFLKHGWKVGLALGVLISWLRRFRRLPVELGATIAGIYIFVLTLSDGFSFQYFAWSLPFWFFFPRWFFVPAILLVSGYIYFLYWHLCGNPWLLGLWDFNGHPQWPLLIVAFRNAAYLLFCAGAIWFAISTTAQAFRARQ